MQIHFCLSASPEIELLLSSRIRGDMPTGVCMKAQPGERSATDEPYHRADVSSSSSSSSSRPTSQDKYMRSSRNAQVEEPSGNSGAAITPPSITVNDAVENDDPPPYVAIPPPYSAIAPPNHVGWPYGPFSFGNSYSTDASPYTVEMPLAPFQSSRAPTAFHPEETNRRHMSLPLTPYRFFKFGYRSGLRERLPADDRITEKIEDRGSRKYGAILMAAAVIISLMALSLMVRFIMEKSWWRG
ncbi:uncharacterized protein LOC116850055 isoform X2 [Odontomachus brunneus]|uniref:uncharacterized protein LOC116850055 isoform X2 n=1 Tax=Odontomachus brunneus TaxID=486640 RepID=UPI0013F19EC8|nr:uncharacterized protein LOC116850055 isoform X2 [Odontomachus brunneus]